MKSTKIQIPWDGGNEWTVFLVPPDSDELKTDGVSNWGIAMPKSKRIFVDAEVSDADTVLIHELTHAVLFETQIKELKKFDEEDMCELMSIYGRQIINLADKVWKGWGEQDVQM